MKYHLSHGFVKTQSTPEVVIHYVETNQNPQAPLVLLLHGFPEFWYAWREYFDPLAEAGFHCVALDLRGYNDSSKPEEIEQYNLEHLVEDLKRVVEHFGKKPFIVGHDWGGIITWEFASLYPELCRGIAVINAPHRASLKQNFSLKQAMKFWYTYFFQLPILPEYVLSKSNFKILGQLLQKQSMVKDAYTPLDLKEYKDAFVKKGFLHSAINYYRANLARFGFGEIKKIQVPSLLIWGEQDAALEKNITEGMQKFFDKNLSKFYFPQASHWVHREFPEKVIDVLLGFFKSDVMRSEHA